MGNILKVSELKTRYFGFSEFDIANTIAKYKPVGTLAIFFLLQINEWKIHLPESRFYNSL